MDGSELDGCDGDDDGAEEDDDGVSDEGTVTVTELDVLESLVMSDGGVAGSVLDSEVPVISRLSVSVRLSSSRSR